MADIDFDELDKAVNDLMANVDTSRRTAGLDEPEEKVVTIPAVSGAAAPTPAATPAPITPPVEAPVVPTVPPAASPTPVVAAPASPSLAMKRRGQFMDIVHPSRDMNTPKPVSRQGATIQPGNDVIAASASQQNESSAMPVSQSVETPESVPSAWPDPIDMANTSVETPEVAAVPAIAPESSADATAEAPLTSPFLPDAKPEKRPLGSPMPTEDTTSSVQEAPVNDTQTPATPEPTPAVVLPEEFSGDLMAVESRDLSSHPEQQVALPAPAEQPKLEAGEEEALIPAVASPEPVEQSQQASAQPQTQLPAGGSIAQQYTEQPSSGDQSNGSIYDTSAYHQPIEPVAQTKKKTPTSVWIMVGVGLLLLGAIGGAAYFYFTR